MLNSLEHFMGCISDQFSNQQIPPFCLFKSKRPIIIAKVRPKTIINWQRWHKSIAQSPWQPMFAKGYMMLKWYAFTNLGPKKGHFCPRDSLTIHNLSWGKKGYNSPNMVSEYLNHSLHILYQTIAVVLTSSDQSKAR